MTLLNGPAFRESNGTCITAHQFNKSLKGLLSVVINYNKKRFLSHSFRAAMASIMGSAGFSNDVIKRQGRWCSKAFFLYCKTVKAQRFTEHRELSKRLAAL